jgi:isopentenyldiphosphate isomerase
MELWDVYDKDRYVKDYTMVRGGHFQDGDYHLVVHSCIFNAKGQMLIQQRQPFKEGWPNLWDVTVGGSAVAGENSQRAMEREMVEEIGYACDLSNERPFITVNYETGFDDWYLIERDIDISTLRLQYEEVQAVQWADKAQILEMINAGEFIAYYPCFIDMLFLMRNHRGCFRLD